MSPHECCGCGRTTTLPSRRSVVAALRVRRASRSPLFAAAAAAQSTADDERFMRMAIEEARRADFPFGAVIVRDGKVLARGRNLGRTTAIRPRMARWSRSGASSTSIRRGAARRHALHLGRTLRDVHGRDPVVPHRAAGVRRVGRRNSPPGSTRSCCRAPTSPPPRNSRRSRSPAACWRTRRWRCSKNSAGERA